MQRLHHARGDAFKRRVEAEPENLRPDEVVVGDESVAGDLDHLHGPRHVAAVGIGLIGPVGVGAVSGRGDEAGVLALVAGAPTPATVADLMAGRICLLVSM